MRQFGPDREILGMPRGYEKVSRPTKLSPDRTTGYIQLVRHLDYRHAYPGRL